ncbi:MAG: hypothetical protein QM820_02475 [Minicystis sp.]
MKRPAQTERREENRVAEIGRERGDVRVAGVAREREALGHAANVVDQIPVLDGHALGLARRAGGEEHISEVAGAGPALDTCIALGGDHRGVAVEADHRDPARGQRARETALRHHHTGARVLDELGQALWRIGRIERHVCATSLHDGEHADHEIDRAAMAEADHGLGPDTPLAQVIGQPVGSRVQLAEREPRGARGHCDRVGRRIDHGLEQLVDAVVRRVRSRRVVPPGEQRLSLGLGQHGNLTHLARGILGHRFEQVGQVADHPIDGGAVEEIDVVIDRDPERPVAPLAHEEGEVVLDGGHIAATAAQLEPGQLHGLARRVLHGEDDLEERRAARIRLGLKLLHQPLERHILVRISTQADVPHLRQQLGEGGAVIDLGAQHERVDEEADQLLGVGAVAVRDAGPDHHVTLPRPAVEQEIEAREEDHVKGHALAAGQLLQGLADVARKDLEAVRSAIRLHRRARPIGGQLDGVGRAVELLLPVGDLPIERLARQPLALPGRVIGILNRKLGKTGLLAGLMGTVERRQLAIQDPARPAVGDDVMEREEEDVLLLADHQEARADERTNREIEWAPRLFAGLLAGVLLALGDAQVGPAHHRKAEVHLRMNDLHRAAIDRLERRAQHLVPAHDLAQSLFERLDVEPARQTEHGRHVVERAVRLELVEEPEALLREGEHQVPLARDLLHRRDGRALGLVQRRLDLLGEAGDRGRLEDGPEREVDLECVTRAGDDLGSRAASGRPARRTCRGRRSAPCRRRRSRCPRSPLQSGSAERHRYPALPPAAPAPSRRAPCGRSCRWA